MKYDSQRRLSFLAELCWLSLVMLLQCLQHGVVGCVCLLGNLGNYLGNLFCAVGSFVLLCRATRARPVLMVSQAVLVHLALMVLAVKMAVMDRRYVYLTIQVIDYCSLLMLFSMKFSYLVTGIIFCLYLPLSLAVPLLFVHCLRCGTSI